MANDNSPDIIELCETILTNSASDNQVHAEGFDAIRKDRSDVQDKSGCGVILFTRNSFRRRPELETSYIETIDI